MRSGVGPPPFLRRVLAFLLPAEDRELELAELDELYRRRAGVSGRGRADLWYASEVARFAVGLSMEPTRRMGMGAGRCLRGIWTDARHGARTLLRAPTYALVVAVTLGVGIGANGTVYALANWVLLRPVPGVADPEELVTVRLQVDGYVDRIAHPDYEDLTTTIPSLSGLAGTSAVEVHAAGERGAERVTGELVSAGYFNVLGVPLEGRGFLPEEAGTPGVRSVVVSERLAASLLDGPAVGATIQVNGQPYRIVGVARAGFRGVDLPGTSDAWFPAGSFADVLSWLHPEALTNRGETVWERLVGRRTDPSRPVPVIEAEANAALDQLRDGVRVGRALTAEQQLRVYVGIGLPHGLRDQVSRTLTLMGVAGLLLLVLAAANTANLALARAIVRREQVVVRRALGAAGWRLARQSLVENVLLGGLGGLVGTALTLGGVLLFRNASLAEGGAALGGAVLDLRVLAFLAGASVLSGILFGSVPASFAARFAPSLALREGTRATASGRRARSTLVVAQFALSVTLTMGASQLARTIWNIQQVELGVDTRGVVLGSLEPGIQYGDDRTRELLGEVLPAVQSLEDVQAAGLISLRPYEASYYPGVLELPGGGERVVGRSYRVSAGLLDVLGVGLLEGRDFTPEEANGGGAEPVVILNATAARRLFPEGEVVGRQVVRYGQPARVVGVVEDARLHAVLEPAVEYVFDPLLQWGPPSNVTIVVRSRAGTGATAAALRDVIARFDRDLPLYDVVSLQAHLETLTGDRRAAARLGVTVALLGAFLAAVGLYGSIAHALAERRRELGIRVIVGADPRALSASVARFGLTLGVSGALMGVAGGVLLGRAMRSLLWEVGAFDAAAAAVAMALAVALAFASSLPPARRLLKADPLAALRE